MLLTNTIATPMKTAAPAGLLHVLLETLRTWRERARTRAELATLSDRELRDFGVSRSDALTETGKPFWRM